MTQKEFWEHIQKSKRSDTDEHVERLVARLAKLRVVDIIEFGHFWDSCIREAYDWNLWGAAYIIHGGCSDDGFHYFCQWLILQGRDVFKGALKKPDSLAKVLDLDDFTECYANPVSAAWFLATGLPDTEGGYDVLEAAAKAVHGEPKPYPDLKDNWDHEDDAQMRKRFPKLWALYTDGEADE